MASYLWIFFMVADIKSTFTQRWWRRRKKCLPQTGKRTFAKKKTIKVLNVSSHFFFNIKKIKFSSFFFFLNRKLNIRGKKQLNASFTLCNFFSAILKVFFKRKYEYEGCFAKYEKHILRFKMSPEACLNQVDNTTIKSALGIWLVRLTLALRGGYLAFHYAERNRGSRRMSTMWVTTSVALGTYQNKKSLCKELRVVGT